MEEVKEKPGQGVDLGITEHMMSVDEVCQKFDTHEQNGLTDELVEVNRQKFGTNQISPPVPPSIVFRLVKHILQGVSSLMVSGAVVCMMSFLGDIIGDVGSKVDLENLFLGLTLVTFITITGVVSYIRDRMASSVLRKTVSMVTLKTRVVRNGQKTTIEVKNVVVGDLVDLKYGDEVPADVRVIQSVGFKVDSAPLTGISEPKSITAECTHTNPLITHNMLYASTYGVEGSCRGIVIRVGDSTVLGRITGITSQLKEKQTPLSKDVTKLILTFTSIGIVFAIVCWVAAMRLDYSWSNTTVFFVGVCVAVVPESLLAAIKVCHSAAAKRLISKNCIAKRFDAIENLGSTSVLCIDKTGTLTENKLSVCCVWNGTKLTVASDKIKTENEKERDAYTVQIRDLLRCIILTSKATVEKTGIGEADIKVKDGEPADIALLKFSFLNFPASKDLNSNQQKLFEAPFNYRTFYQLSIYLEQNRKKCQIVVRGAPERIFELCSTIVIHGKQQPITAKIKVAMEDALQEMAERQSRVLGFCDKVISYDKDTVFSESASNYPVSEYRFLGLVSLSDPPRSGTAEFIARLRSASIKVVMLTGDHPATAKAIAKAVGILKTDDNGESESQTIVSVEPKLKSVLTDTDFRKMMTGETLEKFLRDSEELVFARLSPEQKAIIVETFQRQGELVTMVGDGMNDCAAMRAADTSIAMGLESSEAAKEICDIVILDNTLTPIINGIEQGRLVFENMKKCFAFAISSNIPAVLPFFLFLFLGIPLPINPISIIVLTIGIDMLPAIALAYEPPEWDLMAHSISKNSRKHQLFTGRLLERAYARVGVVEFCAAMFSYVFVMSENGFHISRLVFISQRWYSDRVVEDSHGQEWTVDQRKHLEDVAQTVYFYAVALVQFAHLISCKTRRESIFVHGISNWRLILAVVIPVTLTIVIVQTQILHFIETPRIEAVPPGLLLPAIPFALFIFIYDEFRRLLIRKFQNKWLGKRLDF